MTVFNNEMTRNQLREECRDRGLKVGGLKKDLIARLNEYEAAQEVVAEEIVENQLTDDELLAMGEEVLLPAAEHPDTVDTILAELRQMKAELLAEAEAIEAELATEPECVALAVVPQADLAVVAPKVGRVKQAKALASAALAIAKPVAKAAAKAGLSALDTISTEALAACDRQLERMAPSPAVVVRNPEGRLTKIAIASYKVAGGAVQAFEGAAYDAYDSGVIMRRWYEACQRGYEVSRPQVEATKNTVVKWVAKTRQAVKGGVKAIA